LQWGSCFPYSPWPSGRPVGEIIAGFVGWANANLIDGDDRYDFALSARIFALRPSSKRITAFNEKAVLDQIILNKNGQHGPVKVVQKDMTE
jgi:hypothetical protein